MRAVFVSTFPGFGLSDASKSTYSLKGIADALLGFIRDNKWSKVILVGHSMGGQIAIHAALKAPHLISRLVLISPAGFEQFSMWDKQIIQSGMSMMSWLGSPENYLKQTISACFYTNPRQGDKMIDDLVTLMKRHSPTAYLSMVNSYITAMLQESVWTRLSELSMPVLTIFGDQDALIPNKMIHATTTRALALQGSKEIVHGTLHVLKQAGALCALGAIPRGQCDANRNLQWVATASVSWTLE